MDSYVKIWDGTNFVGVTNGMILVNSAQFGAIDRTKDSIDVKDTGGVTHTAYIVGTSQSIALIANVNRKFLSLQSDGSPIYIALGTTANLSQGIRLGASQLPLVFDNRFVPTVSVNAIAGVTATLLITEG